MRRGRSAFSRDAPAAATAAAAAALVTTSLVSLLLLFATAGPCPSPTSSLLVAARSSATSSTSSESLRRTDAEAHLSTAWSRPPVVERALSEAKATLSASSASTRKSSDETGEGEALSEHVGADGFDDDDGDDGGTDDENENENDLLLSRRRRHSSPSTKLPPVLTNRPLIGILSQPGDPATGQDSYIAASYVKFVESAGARVVPFFHDAPEHETDARFAAVNGFLIPGGAARLAPGHSFFDAASRVIDLATDSNAKKRDYFPILAVCLGFETLGIHLSGNKSLLSKFDAEDTAAPLYFTEAAERSRLFGSMPRRVRESLANRPLARESHSWGISLASFENEPNLKENVDVLSLSSDPEGRVYVSSMEHKSLPFSATQWHPEKNAYEWGDKLHIPHSEAAVEVTRALSKVFVAGARRNSHVVTKKRATRREGEEVENNDGDGDAPAPAPADVDVVAEDELLIYNHPLTFTGRHRRQEDRPWLDEAYIFPPWETWKRCMELERERERRRRNGRNGGGDDDKHDGGDKDEDELCRRYRSPSADVQPKKKEKEKREEEQRHHHHVEKERHGNKVSLRLAGV